jgi:hypothetical protein
LGFVNKTKESGTLNLDAPSQFDGAVDRQFEKFRGPLSVMAHCHKEVLTPPCHT